MNHDHRAANASNKKWQMLANNHGFDSEKTMHATLLPGWSWYALADFYNVTVKTVKSRCEKYGIKNPTRSGGPNRSASARKQMEKIRKNHELCSYIQERDRRR